jgi:CubicO group peptidase (beta-lactamase class C family)
MPARSLASAFLALIVVGCSGPDLGGDSVDALAHHLDENIPVMMEADGVPGVSIAVVDDGAVVWSSAYGWTDIASRIPMTVQTVNRTESISKPVTAMGVMTLVERGLVGLDDPFVDLVDRWGFPDSGSTARNITVRQLLNHTAGIVPGSVGVHYPPEGHVPTLDENLTDEFGLVLPPGSSFLYSNVGFNLLELLIEEVTGEDFASYMEREVLQPIGMESASFNWSDHLDTPVPVGYDLDGSPVPVYVYPEKASGGLFASVEDIARFVSAGLTGSHYDAGGAVLERETLEQMYAPNVEINGLFRFAAESYGLGHFVETLSDGSRAVWHGGQGHGWMTDFHSIPDNGDAIVVMANSQRSWPMIAQILADWSEWNDVEPVGFSIVARVSSWSRIAIGVIATLTLWLLWQLATGLVAGRGRSAPRSTASVVARTGRALIGFALLALVVWDLSQDYSFFSSILPGTLGWLRATVTALGATLVVSALIPFTRKPKPRHGRVAAPVDSRGVHAPRRSERGSGE